MKKNDNYIYYTFISLFSGIFGYIYEVIFYLFNDGKLINRGITFGPWIPIYAIGGVLITYFLSKYKNKPLIIFLLSILISGIIEYFFGYILFNIFNLRLWNYNTEILNFGNINGYVCLRSVLFFGVSSLFLIYVLSPLIKKIIKNKLIVKIGIILFILFLIDTIYGSFVIII